MLNLENGNEFNVDTIRNALKEEINNSDYARFLEVAKLKDETISIRAKKTVVARIRFSDKESNIEIRSKYSAILPHGQVQRAEGEEEWTNIPIISMDDILARKKELAEIFMMVLASMISKSRLAISLAIRFCSFMSGRIIRYWIIPSLLPRGIFKPFVPASFII